ncbi:16S rRNA (guanine(966)-N(2))-methyltransferase RsmD [Tsukamurella sp. PLM1]|uniref:16S rRNA (guanine(966)-N(2))-methyltransferase RsmD n=1 Tax=Tsukamurella sp. PLM1 TaxID=2929795 RepID=UPI002055D633|nr:16S rRNA (guanine(966)-N(2))-methyltransferase RsmD [Tsukamurella sp. PLM1]BDH56782.1 16S rRNA (guanine(966)-N(2))-methyltransferase RsmD [Tsukamurella sp. PLM1]
MTRIIAGAARGRRLAVPPRGTRPTSDRVREAVFSALASRLDFDGAAVLDLYAGSGALGLEALSRGAGSAVLVDSDPKAVAVLGRNARAVGLDGAEAHRRTARAFLELPARPFDLVFLDPPYDVPADVVDGELAALTGGWLAPDAFVVVERSARTPAVTWPEGLELELARDYGETRIEVAVWQDRAS